MTNLELVSKDDLIEELCKRGIVSCGAILAADGETIMDGYDCNVSVWDRDDGSPEQRIEIVTFLFNYVIGKIADSGELTEEQILEIVRRNS